MNKRGGALIDDALIVRLIRLTLFGHGKLHVTRAKKESSVQSQMQSTVNNPLPVSPNSHLFNGADRRTSQADMKYYLNFRKPVVGGGHRAAFLFPLLHPEQAYIFNESIYYTPSCLCVCDTFSSSPWLELTWPSQRPTHLKNGPLG
jgi:hypothetical protein